MAEAVVEDRPSVHTRFYCHMCNVEINISNADYTCPLCAGGFIEELPPSTPSTSSSSATIMPGNVGPLPRQQPQQQPQQRQQPQLPLDMDILRNELATLLASRNGPNLEISIDPGNGRINTRTNAANASGSGANTSGGRGRPQNLDRFDNVLLNFLLSISGETEMPAFGNSQMFVMGNLGDYAWGREGLDTIVTQLLNQMETSGPPPLSRQKIDEIPKVEVTESEVKRKLQCSVCWEDFTLKEIVRKLPCSHIYHDECIVPWLDLHGTCPICRKMLSEEDDTDFTMECPVHGAPTESATTSSQSQNQQPTSTTTTSTNTNSSSDRTTLRTSRESQIFGFDDMDFSNNDLD